MPDKFSIAYVVHQLRHNLPEILEKSKKNCHTPCLHSIVLSATPGRMVRMFVAVPGNRLWGNHPDVIREEQSLAFHPHHCDLTFVPLKGTLGNWIVRGPHQYGQHPPMFYGRSYRYVSPITHHGLGSFRFEDEISIQTVEVKEYEPGESFTMHAQAYHTVFTAEHTWTAWMVLEGSEDQDYIPLCWSLRKLHSRDLKGLYQPMCEGELIYLLQQVFGTEHIKSI